MQSQPLILPFLIPFLAPCFLFFCGFSLPCSIKYVGSFFSVFKC
uniref:Uncharacterized protein n=1 Tax=Rhizophora mucronata TaxID=61149 RepID=A0A2P2Q1W3_RHIMU